MTRSTKAAWMSLVAATGLLWSLSSWAGTLHSFCFSGTACTDTGSVNETTSSSPNFGFWDASGTKTGTLLLDILVPNNYTAPSGFTITVGASGTRTASQIGTGVNAGEFLTNYLNANTTPSLGLPDKKNPVNAWLTITQAADPSASGYFVYQADLGINTIAGSAGYPPELNAGTLQTGTVILGYLGTSNCGEWDCFCRTSWTWTANSAALYEGHPSVPEPGTLALFGAGLLGCVLFIRRRARQS